MRSKPSPPPDGVDLSVHSPLVDCFGFGITCKTCVRGTTAKVTCHFTEDLNASQADFSLYHKGPHDAADTLALVTAQTEPAADSCGNTFQILFGITFGILVIAAVSALLYHWHSRRKQTTSDDEAGPKKEEEEKAIDPDKKGNTYCSIQEDGGLQGQSPTRPEKNHPRQRNTDRAKEHTYVNVSRSQRTQGVGDNQMQIEEDTDNPERTKDGDDEKEADCSKQALLDLGHAQH